MSTHEILYSATTDQNMKIAQHLNFFIQTCVQTFLLTINFIMPTLDKMAQKENKQFIQVS